MKSSRRHRARAASTLLALSVVVLLAFGVGSSSALGPGYTNVVFSDGFESGNLSNWNGLLANGSATVVAGSAHAGSYGLNMSNATGQHMWDLAYDGTRQGLIFYPYRTGGSTEIFTGTGSAPAGTWFRVEVQ